MGAGDAAARWIVFQLLRYDDIAPEDVLAMWHELDADDGRIALHLRNALALGAPLPALAGVTWRIDDALYGQPAALTVEVDGTPHHFGESALVRICRQLLAADDPPTPPRKFKLGPLPVAAPRPPKGDARQFALF